MRARAPPRISNTNRPRGPTHPDALHVRPHPPFGIAAANYYQLLLYAADPDASFGLAEAALELAAGAPRAPDGGLRAPIERHTDACH